MAHPETAPRRRIQHIPEGAQDLVYGGDTAGIWPGIASLEPRHGLVGEHLQHGFVGEHLHGFVGEHLQQGRELEGVQGRGSAGVVARWIEQLLTRRPSFELPSMFS